MIEKPCVSHSHAVSTHPRVHTNANRRPIDHPPVPGARQRLTGSAKKGRQDDSEDEHNNDNLKFCSHQFKGRVRCCLKVLIDECMCTDIYVCVFVCICILFFEHSTLSV